MITNFHTFQDFILREEFNYLFSIMGILMNTRQLIYFQLDDQEFDIPPVTTTPTLESILNEVFFHV